MKQLFLPTILVMSGLLSACSVTENLAHAPVQVTERAQLVQAVSASNQTLLLVSLADGSVIMQTINSEADICFKQNSASATTCLVQGAPIVDPMTQAVIGYEMRETQIELVASSRY